MNVYELALCVSVLAGLIVGGRMGKECGGMGTVIGCIVGVFIAVVTHLLIAIMSAALARLSRMADDPPKNTWRRLLCSLIGVLSVITAIASPIATIGILSMLATWLRK